MPHTLDPAIASIASFFQQNGYVVIDPQIPDELIEETNSVLRDLFVPTYDPWYADETRVQDLWFFNEQVRQIALAPRVLEILRALYGREPLPFQTLNFRVGSQQRTHSDIIHFDSFPFGFMCGVWLAMEDVDRTNGPLHYFPVSHTLPRFDMREVRVPENAAPGYARYGFYEDFVEGVLKRESFDRAEVPSSGPRTSFTAGARFSTAHARGSRRSRTTTSRGASTTRRCSPIPRRDAWPRGACSTFARRKWHRSSGKAGRS
jgi:hypothetical protein